MLNNRSVIFGLSSTDISEDELSFFKEVSPLGFILFKRNVDNPGQVRGLVDSLRECAGQDCPILIDQEGGRVARLKPPHWPDFPSMEGFARTALDDLPLAKQQVYDNYLSIGQELINLGINVDCAPVCDLSFEGAHDIIGDRAFGSDVDIVSALARKASEGLLKAGVTPIIKHIPGHGRAKADSHKELPVVDTSVQELWDTDFKVFQNLSDMPWAMTAHIVYSDIDPDNPATLSSKVINLIRHEIGFKGVLVSDDLSMEALTGSYADRAAKALAAGCDVVLHCNGKMEEMVQVAEGIFS